MIHTRPLASVKVLPLGGAGLTLSLTRKWVGIPDRMSACTGASQPLPAAIMALNSGQPRTSTRGMGRQGANKTSCDASPDCPQSQRAECREGARTIVQPLRRANPKFPAINLGRPIRVLGEMRVWESRWCASISLGSGLVRIISFGCQRRRSPAASGASSFHAG